MVTDLFLSLLELVNRSTQLRHLRLVSCGKLSTERLNVVVEKLPLLEEFHLYYTYIDKEAIETIGCCCPLLKSFTYNQKWIIKNYKYRDDTLNDNDEALAIAKNIPGLRHLQLEGNRMTNIGLQALLDGCPHLDSLVLEQCLNINLNGDVGKRCSKIKDMHFHLDLAIWSHQMIYYLYEDFQW
ncbi:unnamed protein product [Ilex paraguariensis]|uniref:Uncharacterized protein n=1 Tax=Ilex paraguariensis TaxID=185542 RepID=A0ABC8RD07_9AQUA